LAEMFQKLRPRSLWLVFIALQLLSQTAAEGACSLVVHVVDETGAEVATDVVVTEADGTRHVVEHGNGGARFCNLGILPVIVAVDEQGCNQTVVQDVRLRWDEVAVIRIVSNLSWCLSHPPRRPVCKVLIRGFTPNVGGPLTFGRLVVEGVETRVEADAEHGRFFFVLPFQSSARIRLAAPEMVEEVIPISCGAKEDLVEKKIVMKPAR
jgi:hypothetical protein